MNRFFASLLAFFLLLSLYGCQSKDTTAFYYQRIDYEFGTPTGVIEADPRDISGHEGDLSYLLSLYLVGPMDEALTSPFPTNTQLLSVHLADGTVYVELSDITSSVSESQFTLACACMTLTCLELEDANEVTIVSGNRSVTMTRDSIMLFDTSPAAATEDIT